MQGPQELEERLGVYSTRLIVRNAWKTTVGKVLRPLIECMQCSPAAEATAPRPPNVPTALRPVSRRVQETLGNLVRLSKLIRFLLPYLTCPFQPPSWLMRISSKGEASLNGFGTVF